MVDDFRDDPGLIGGPIYDKKGSCYLLKPEYSNPRAPEDCAVPATYPPIRERVEERHVYARLGGTGVDSRMEAILGVKPFAAIRDDDQTAVAVLLEAQGTGSTARRLALDQQE